MGTIVISENVTLDGVIQDPAGDEGFKLGGWVGLIKDRPQLNKLALDEALGAEALLLGRRSYEWLAARWPSRSGELADRLNNLPKYVVSSTLEDPEWNNSTVLNGDVVAEVSKLKQELNGEVVVPGSFQLLRTLMEHDLVDELRLKVFPVVLGAGERLFGETSDKKPMRLVDTQTFEADVVFLTYEPVADTASPRVLRARERARQSEVREDARVAEEGERRDLFAVECEHDEAPRPRDPSVPVIDVEAEGGLTVGAGRDDPAPGVAHACPMLEEEGDGLFALVLERVRRHRQPGVLGE